MIFSDQSHSNVLKGWKNPDPVYDQDEFVPLPDLNDQQGDDFVYGGDPNLWNDDYRDSDTESSNSNDNLLPNTDPFYANQEEDLSVQQIQYEFDQYIDGLFK